MACPICTKPTDPIYRPFCCRRCADIDLGRWLSESYVVPTDEAPEDPAEPEGRTGSDPVDRPH